MCVGKNKLIEIWLCTKIHLRIHQYLIQHLHALIDKYDTAISKINSMEPANITDLPEEKVSITFPFCFNQHSDNRMLQSFLKMDIKNWFNFAQTLGWKWYKNQTPAVIIISHKWNVFTLSRYLFKNRSRQYYIFHWWIS